MCMCTQLMCWKVVLFTTLKWCQVYEIAMSQWKTTHFHAFVNDSSFPVISCAVKLHTNVVIDKLDAFERAENWLHSIISMFILPVGCKVLFVPGNSSLLWQHERKHSLIVCLTKISPATSSTLSWCFVRWDPVPGVLLAKDFDIVPNIASLCENNFVHGYEMNNQRYKFNVVCL